MKLSNGNSKIGKDTLIFNMTSATDCPSKKLGLCKVCGICYAMKSERQYPSVLPYRRNQQLDWNRQTVTGIYVDIVKAIGRKDIKYIRFSESGDFTSQADVDKMIKLAWMLKSIGITLYGYTARKDLDYSKLPSNMIVNGSSHMISNSFVAVKEYTANSIRCAGDCSGCTLCKVENFNIVEVLFH